MVPSALLSSQLIPTMSLSSEHIIPYQLHLLEFEGGAAPQLLQNGSTGFA
jgi:hypothetical protein